MVGAVEDDPGLEQSQDALIKAVYKSLTRMREVRAHGNDMYQSMRHRYPRQGWLEGRGGWRVNARTENGLRFARADTWCTRFVGGS